MKRLDLQKKFKFRRKSIYFLPNAFTTAAIFSGFYAIVQAINDCFEIAVIAVFFSMILDGIDGRIARLTNTESEFGEQYDSLADMISFGMAPAIIIYEWSLVELGRWGWLSAFIYVVGAALRLARFNTNINTSNNIYFEGLPSPSAAALVAGFVWLSIDNKIDFNSKYVDWLAFSLTTYAGISMISNAPFYSGKNLVLSKNVPFWSIVFLVIIFVFISSNPPIFLFSLFVVYSLSGWLILIYSYLFLRNKSNE